MVPLVMNAPRPASRPTITMKPPPVSISAVAQNSGTGIWGGGAPISSFCTPWQKNRKPTTMRIAA